MDCILNPRIETQTIYEIYRACRLCGAGAGYKMPIIQNVVELDGTDVELKQKIRECVQIEVHQDDKMPPLICELCVDKVNDFYEFFDMCRQTNKRTRMRLGLPLQTKHKDLPESGDSILGVTETVYLDDSDGEPLSKQKENDGKLPKNKYREKLALNKDRTNVAKNKYREKMSKTKNKDGDTFKNYHKDWDTLSNHKSKDVKMKKESDVRIKIENYQLQTQRHAFTNSSKSTKGCRRNYSLRRSGRNSKSLDAMAPISSDKKKRLPTEFNAKSILKKEILIKIEDTLQTPRLRSTKEDKGNSMSFLTPRLKRVMEKDLKEVPSKKVKISTESKLSPKGAKSPRPPTGEAPPGRSLRCPICKSSNKSPQGHASHMRGHLVTYTNVKLACNACGEWFRSHDEACLHHRRHKTKGVPYTCRRCTSDFKHQQAFDEHFDKKQCIPWEEVPDVKCDKCWRFFPTQILMSGHKCPGQDGRRGGKCVKCKREFVLLKNLTKHEATCTKRKGVPIVDPDVLSRLKPMQVRVARCDPLLSNIKQEHYDVSTVDTDFGLDRCCYYPYISSVRSVRIKTELGIEEYDSMVAIKEEIKEEFCTEEDYVHWDSEESGEDGASSNSVLNPFAKKKQLPTLSTLSLKTIFSKKFLGRVPRKKRKVKTEKNAFGSTLNISEFESDMRKDVDNIIKNLDNDFDKNDALVEGNTIFNSLLQNNVLDNPTNYGNDLLSKGSIEVDRVSSDSATDILQWNESDEKMIDDNFDDSSADSEQNEQNFDCKHFNVNKHANEILTSTRNVKDFLSNETASTDSVSTENEDGSIQRAISGNIHGVKVQAGGRGNSESCTQAVLELNSEILVADSNLNKSMDLCTLSDGMEGDNLENSLHEASSDTTNIDSAINKTDGSLETRLLVDDTQYSKIMSMEEEINNKINRGAHESEESKVSVEKESAIYKNEERVPESRAVYTYSTDDKKMSMVVEINSNIDGVLDEVSVESESAIDKNNKAIEDEMALETRLLCDNSADNICMSLDVELNGKIDEDALENKLLNNDGEENLNDDLAEVLNNEQILLVNDSEMTQDQNNVIAKMDAVMLKENFKDPVNNEHEVSGSDTRPDIICNTNIYQSDIKNDINPSDDGATEHLKPSKNNGCTESNDYEVIKNTNNDVVVNGLSRNNDKFRLDDVSDTEMEDRKLMEALDAQIGENIYHTDRNNGNSGQNNNADYVKDKITLEDLLSKRDDNSRSMDLDSISDDDFNFDI